MAAATANAAQPPRVNSARSGATSLGRSAAVTSGGSAAFMRPVQPDSALSAVVGSNAIPRTELTKKLWAYIKRNGLQDAKNRRAINADDKLRPVFGGRSQVTMFDMTKLVNKHVS